jgi:heat-inducible transcriptional repressor
MVLVLYGGSVRQQMLTLADALSQEALSATATRLNTLCDLLNSEQIRLKGRTLDTPLEREVIDLIADTLQDADADQHVIAYRDGLSDVVSELPDGEAVQQALHLLEEHSLIGAIFSEMIGARPDDVQVVIGGDGRWAEVRHLSLVLTRYGVSGQAMGMLGVLGPTRMRYGRAIASVRYVASLMSSLLTAAYGVESPDDSHPA